MNLEYLSMTRPTARKKLTGTYYGIRRAWKAEQQAEAPMRFCTKAKEQRRRGNGPRYMLGWHKDCLTVYSRIHGRFSATSHGTATHFPPAQSAAKQFYCFPEHRCPHAFMPVALTRATKAAVTTIVMVTTIKIATIGNGIRCSMEFSLEQLQELGALPSPLHTRLSGSDIHPSAGAASSYRRHTRAKKTRSGAPSQTNRAPFTQEEDARLM